MTNQTPQNNEETNLPKISQTLFHVTKLIDLPSIISKGLIPKNGPRSHESGTNQPLVYLFNSIEGLETSLGNWLGDMFDEDEELAIIYIDSSKLTCTNSQLTSMLNITPDFLFEVTSSITIPPQFFLKIVDDQSNEIPSAMKLLGDVKGADYKKFTVELIHTLLPVIVSNLKYQGKLEDREPTNDNIRKALYKQAINMLIDEDLFYHEEPIPESHQLGLFIKGHVRDVWDYLNFAYDQIHSIDFEKNLRHLYENEIKDDPICQQKSRLKP